jgi:RHS repeat-associated protein
MRAAACASRCTGKERDAESGLDYFEARYYENTTGRFMSPDWSAQVEPVPYAKLGNPQTLNLYGYMQNNPLGGVDQDGHCATPSAGGELICQPAPNAIQPDLDGQVQHAQDEETLEVEQHESAQQHSPADQNLTNVVYNETGSLRPNPDAKPGAPGSAEDLANGQQAVAEIANRVINDGHPGRVAPDTLSARGARDVQRDPNAVDAYGRSRSAADAALGGSNISDGARQYRTRVGGNVTTPLGSRKHHRGETITQHYGPFVEGGHTVVIVVAP